MAEVIFNFLVEIIGDVQFTQTMSLMQLISYVCTFLITCIIISPIIIFIKNIGSKRVK